MSSVLPKIYKLIALTENPNENEARSAAYQAVRLIREHKIILTDPERRAGYVHLPRTEHCGKVWSSDPAILMHLPKTGGWSQNGHCGKCRADLRSIHR